MIELTVTNQHVLIRGASPAHIRALAKVTSYKVAGHAFSPAFRAHKWDGREKLMTFSRKAYRAPAGLLLDIVQALKRRHKAFRVIDETSVRGPKLGLVWNSAIVLRDYQHEAVEAVLAQPLRGRGIMKMPIRSGKTKTAAAVIQRLDRRCIFLVPSQMLLHQTSKALAEALPGASIGMIGDGVWDLQDITVATLQTLARLRGVRANRGRRSRKVDPRYKDLIKRFDVVISDEAHHIRGGGDWHKVLLDFDARYKIGLSATVYLDNETEQERGIIWLKAACGRVRIDISTSRLVDAGHLMRQNVDIYTVERPDANGKRWSAGLRVRCITQNRYRNRLIATLARHHAVKRGMKTLIIARFHDHIAALCEELDSLGVDYRVITGRDLSSEREDKLDGLIAGDYNVVIGNVLSEGVDVPAIECVINAEGGADVKATVQRQRNLTVSAGKRKALFIDFMDNTNEYFTKHSLARIEAYRSESSFSLKFR